MRVLVSIIGCLFFSSCIIAQNWKPLFEYKKKGFRNLLTDSVNNNLYAYGDLYLDSIQARGIARFDGNKWYALGTGIDDNYPNPYPTTPGIIFSAAIYNNEVYIGGNFHRAGKYRSAGIAKWNGNNWDSIPCHAPQYDPVISGLFGLDNKLFVCGDFDSIGGIKANRIANYDGSNWQAYPPSPSYFNGVGGSLCLYKNEIYLAGNFEDDSITSRKEIIRWDGTEWKDVGGGIKGDSWVQSMVVYKDELYVGGYFNKNAGNAGNYIQKWDGIKWSDVGGGLSFVQNNPNSNAQPFKLMVHKNKLYACGTHKYAGGIPAQDIAEWDGTDWCGFGSTFDNITTGMEFFKDTLYIVGGFWTIDGDSIQSIAKWTGGSFRDTCGSLESIMKNESSKAVQVYPNPSSGILYISIPSYSKMNIIISNTLGQIIYSQRNDQSYIKINTENISKGIYYLHIETTTGEYHKKLIFE